jgi:hypothetical protein
VDEKRKEEEEEKENNSLDGLDSLELLFSTHKKRLEISKKNLIL